MSVWSVPVTVPIKTTGSFAPVPNTKPSFCAGVAGLAAVGTSTSLGAITLAFDVRPEVAEQVESMGAEFVYLDFVFWIICYNASQYYRGIRVSKF